MTALTLANLLGKPAYGNDFDLDGALESCKKATGASSAIGVGRIFFITDSTGIAAIATSGSTGRMGVVPAIFGGKHTDSDAQFFGVTRAGAEIYIESSGVIKQGARVAPDTGGKGKQATGTITDDNAPFVYMGHYGEGTGTGNPPTDAANGDPIRVRLV